MFPVLAQQAPSDGATRLILALVLAGFTLVLLEGVWRAMTGRDDDDDRRPGRRR